MTETVKSLDYTKNILRTIPNNDKMEVVTQTNAVKSPTDSLKATTLVCADAVHQPALCLQPVQQHHRIPCSAGRRKHPCTEEQLRCVAQPGSLIRRQQYGIYYKTRQLLWRPLYLPRRVG